MEKGCRYSCDRCAEITAMLLLHVADFNSQRLRYVASEPHVDSEEDVAAHQFRKRKRELKAHELHTK